MRNLLQIYCVVTLVLLLFATSGDGDNTACTAAPAPLSGTTVVADSTYATATATCLPGYTSNGGSTSATCSNGAWNWGPGHDTQLMCTLDCLPVTPNAGTSQTSPASGPYTQNTVLTMACLTGYSVISGQATATCLNGAWVWGTTNVQLTCGRVCSPPALPASLIAVSPITGTYLVGSNFTVACNTSYVYNSGNSTATCMPNNVWQWMGGGRLNCVPSCVPLQPGLYANLTAETNQSLYIQNDTAEFTCYDGYVYAAGGYTGTCVGPNAWSWTNGATAPLKCIVAPAYASATASFFASTTCSNYVSRPATNDATCLISCLFDNYCSGYAVDSNGCHLDRPQLESAVTAIPCLSRG